MFDLLQIFHHAAVGIKIILVYWYDKMMIIFLKIINWNLFVNWCDLGRYILIYFDKFINLFNKMELDKI